MREDRRLACTVHSLKLAHRGYEVPTNEEVDDEQGQHGEHEPGRDSRDDDKGGEDLGGASEELAQGFGDAALGGVNVATEAVEDAAGGRGLEEMHLAADYGREHVVVHLLGAVDHQKHVEHVAD